MSLQEKTKHITIIDTKEKEYNNTWQKQDNTNWTIEIWRKNKQKTTILYSSFICII